MLMWLKRIALLLGAVILTAGLTGCGTSGGGTGGTTGLDDLDSIVNGLDPDEFGFDEGDRIGMENAEIIDTQFDSVYFAYDSSQIGEMERGKVETVADFMSNDDSINLVIEGHSDERGSNEYNISLSERRALAIRAYLIGLGIDGVRIQTKSYGEEKPNDPGHDESAWSQNRRGEFVLYR